MDRFAEIRPYNDSEVRQVLDNLMQDKDFIDTITRWRFNGIGNNLLLQLIRPVTLRFLKKELVPISDVLSFQKLLAKYIDRMVRDTTSGLTVSGLEFLEQGRSYLFMSNHRDIALDPTFVNYALLNSQHDTARVAIGDNLLSKSFVADLMRLNKCFIVKRSVRGPRQILEAYKTLSSYILHSIEEDNVSVWIAQREGRAKDGNDQTEPAIIKMLAIIRDRKSCEFLDYIKRLRIVPVSISYEYDPCDGIKARELFYSAEKGEYEKSEHEDLRSIESGITKQKGAVHVSFGTPLNNGLDTPEAVAEEVDRQITGNYMLHTTNFYAYHKLYGTIPDILFNEKHDMFESEKKVKEPAIFEKRINGIPPEYRKYALAIYANPVVNKMRNMEN